MNISMSARVGSREAQRWPIDAKVDARDGNRHMGAVAADISVTGLRLRSLTPFRVGQQVWIKLPIIAPREATVRWVSGLSAGCEFSQPIAEYVLEHILKDARTVSEPIFSQGALVSV